VVEHLDEQLVLGHHGRDVEGGVRVQDGVGHDLRDSQGRGLDPDVAAGILEQPADEPASQPGAQSDGIEGGGAPEQHSLIDHGDLRARGELCPDLPAVTRRNQS